MIQHIGRADALHVTGNNAELVSERRLDLCL
jgi:hypothetical protein